MTQNPNILLVVFDSLSQRDLMRHIPNLPTLRRVMSESISFTAAHACSPESGPARASLFTGLDMAVHGVWTDGVALPRHEVPMPAAFARNGYQSWLVGRRQLAGVSNWTTEHAAPGEYHHLHWAHGPLHRSRQNTYLAWLQDADPESYEAVFPRQANPDDTAISGPQRDGLAALPTELSFNAWVGQTARRHMGDTPFFGVAGFVVGATMGGASARVEGFDPRALVQADAAFGALLHDLPENTGLVVTAGRGSVGEGALDPLQAPAINVPLLLSLPGGQAGSVPDPVSTMDIAPTLYELAGIVAPGRLQGQSLISSPPRGWALSRVRTPDMPHQTALTTARWKLCVTHDAPDATQLFDLHADPGETRNLAELPDYQDRLDEMIDTMIDARVALEDRTEARIAKF